MTEPSENSDMAARFTERLKAVDERPVAEHAEIYQQLHGELQAALAEIDAR